MNHSSLSMFDKGRVWGQYWQQVYPYRYRARSHNIARIWKNGQNGRDGAGRPFLPFWAIFCNRARYLNAKGGYTNLYFHAIISLLCTFLRGRCKLTCHHLKANRSLARLHRVSLEPKEGSLCFRGMWWGRYTGGVAVTILGQNTVKATL